MSMVSVFHGIIPPVVTLFDKHGHFDPVSMGKLIDYLIEGGVHGLLFLGSSGEFSQMTPDDRKRVAEFAVHHVAHRVPVLIGTGSPGTDTSVLLSRHAEAIGADGVLVVNPFYWQLSEENLFRHYQQISRSVRIPVLLYNFPDLTGQDLSPDFVLKCADNLENIAGIKETTDFAGHIREMILKVKGKHPDFTVFSGFDDHLFNTLALGGDGGIPATANFAPEIATGLCTAFWKKDYSEAIRLHQKISHLMDIYQLDSPFVSAVKEAVNLRGLDISTGVLPPAKTLSEDGKKVLTELLLREGLLDR
ncbi:dihydrodipicolinate synthase family protein [Sporolactobacillus sp. THM7-4]|nr:dihydrodipicolinate synthase family protein [Sporolactobacillus sp. THM7-4]